VAKSAAVTERAAVVMIMTAVVMIMTAANDRDGSGGSDI
jgi:hypothetical protein